MGTKKIRCPDAKRVGKILELPNGDSYRVRNRKLERKYRWMDHWRVMFGYTNRDGRGVLWRDCPPEITLQFFKWLGEQLPLKSVLPFAKSVMERAGYEIED